MEEKNRKTLEEIASLLTSVLDEDHEDFSEMSETELVEYIHRQIPSIGFLINTDILSGLGTQNSLIRKMSGACEQRRLSDKDDSSAKAVLFIDLNGLKAVNDIKGHAAGDDYIRTLALSIKQNIRDDISNAFRYGGDEFVIILESCPIDAAIGIAERILFGFKMLWNNKYGILSKHIGFSYGVASTDEEECKGKSAEDILSIADKRQYKMKEETKHNREELIKIIKNSL